jgi:hypothetical protein
VRGLDLISGEQVWTYSEIFSGNQLRQDVKVVRCFRDYLLPHLQGVIGFGATEPPSHPEDGDRVSRRNGRLSHLGTAVCPRKFR